MEKRSADGTTRVAKEMAARFFIPPPDIESLTKPIVTAAQELNSPFADVGKAFDHNMRSVVNVVGLPLVLAVRGQHSAMLQTYAVLVANVRAQAFSRRAAGETEQEFKARCRQNALDQATTRVADPPSIEKVAHHAAEFILIAAKDTEVATGADDLLLQGLVMCWSALETLVRDLVVLYVNKHPEAAHRLAQHPVAKRRLDLGKVSLETLGEYGYDASRHMGDIVAGGRDFSDLLVIKATMDALFPDDNRLRDALGDPRVWTLCQRRHLIVHRRGTVDETYVRSTGATDAVGARLTVRPKDVGTALNVVRDAGVAAMIAVANYERFGVEPATPGDEPLPSR